MHSTKRIVIDLLSGNRPETIHVVQGDAYSRVAEIDLRQGKKPWAIPDGVSVAVEYIKPDGTKGLYDTLPDGTQAWNTEGNILTLMLAPQMLTANGTVVTQVRVMLGNTQLSLVKFSVYVHQKITGGESEDYINWRSAFLPQVEGAKAGQYFKILEVDDAGRATKVIAVDAPQGGAVDIPTKLPNPYALTINGTSYDGSEAVSVEIPQGGGGGTPAWELVADITIEEEVKNLTISENMAGQPLSMKAMYMYMYIPASENSTLYFRMSLNDGYNQYTGQQGITANTLHERHMKIETDGLGNAFVTYSLARTNVYTGRNPDAQYGAYMASSNGGMPLGEGKTTIEKINFPEITFPVGSIIKIYKVV